MDNKDWLCSGSPVLSQGVLLDSSVNSDSSPGWVQVPFVVMKIECWGIWERMYKQYI